MRRSGLVLSGGGSKGVFQLGAWRAFRELGIEFDAIVGTSIGAINGAMMAGTEYECAQEMWLNLRMDQCLAFSQSSSLKSNDLLSVKNANFLARELLRQGRLNTAPLRDLLDSYIHEDRVRQAGIRFGLMTTKMPELKRQPFWLDQIPKGRLIDYIMASSRLPILEPVQIDGFNLMDGGLVDNVPIAMLRGIGYRRAVVVDLENRTSVRNLLDDNTQVVLIHDKQELGGFLDINPVVLKRNLRLGYLDAMKAFDQLSGSYYTFTQPEYVLLLKQFGLEHVNGLEQAALIYEVDRSPIYTADQFINQIQTRRLEVQRLYEQKRQTLQIDSKLKALASGRLKVLNLLPPLRLAFLVEVRASALKNGYTPRLPIRLFENIFEAAAALSELPELPSS